MVKRDVCVAEGNGEAVAGADVVLVGEGLADDGAVVVRQAAQDGVAVLAGEEAQAAVAADDVEIAGAEGGALAAVVEREGVEDVDRGDARGGRRGSRGPPARAAG